MITTLAASHNSVVDHSATWFATLLPRFFKFARERKRWYFTQSNKGDKMRTAVHAVRPNHDGSGFADLFGEGKINLDSAVVWYSATRAERILSTLRAREPGIVVTLLEEVVPV
jgi:hypothetical protein